ncbi:MAG TPA: hypothetical protein VHA11_03890 [Bryobacteraceae bacterium]|nr:hypothetical protein [Bryobacteraceae bacterium]
MKAIVQAAVVAVCISYGSAVYAQQDQDKPAQREAPEQGDNQAQQAQQVSYTGCLTKGTGTGQYTIVDQKSGERVSFDAPAKIEKYMNQTVRVTGRAATSGDRAFEPESLQPVSPSCESAPKQ